MAKALVNSGKVELFNVTVGNVKSIIKDEIDGVQQWILPRERLNRKGLPKTETILAIQEIVEGVQPDIVHIWVTENYWSTLSAEGYIKGRVLLEIQGVSSEIAKRKACRRIPFSCTVNQTPVSGGVQIIFCKKEGAIAFT